MIEKYTPPSVESGYWDGMIASAKNSVCNDIELNDDLMQEGRMAVWQALQKYVIGTEEQAKVMVFIVARVAAMNFIGRWYGKNREKITKSLHQKIFKDYKDFFDEEQKTPEYYRDFFDEEQIDEIVVNEDSIKEYLSFLKSRVSEKRYKAFELRYLHDMKLSIISDYIEVAKGTACKYIKNGEELINKFYKNKNKK